MSASRTSSANFIWLTCKSVTPFQKRSQRSGRWPVGLSVRILATQWTYVCAKFLRYVQNWVFVTDGWAFIRANAVHYENDWVRMIDAKAHTYTAEILNGWMVIEMIWNAIILQFSMREYVDVCCSMKELTPFWQSISTEKFSNSKNVRILA